jgi:hypothetical protein
MVTLSHVLGPNIVVVEGCSEVGLSHLLVDRKQRKRQEGDTSIDPHPMTYFLQQGTPSKISTVSQNSATTGNQV